MVALRLHQERFGDVAAILEEPDHVMDLLKTLALVMQKLPPSGICGIIAARRGKV